MYVVHKIVLQIIQFIHCLTVCNNKQAGKMLCACEVRELPCGRSREGPPPQYIYPTVITV